MFNHINSTTFTVNTKNDKRSQKTNDAFLCNMSFDYNNDAYRQTLSKYNVLYGDISKKSPNTGQQDDLFKKACKMAIQEEAEKLSYDLHHSNDVPFRSKNRTTPGSYEIGRRGNVIDHPVTYPPEEVQKEFRSEWKAFSREEPHFKKKCFSLWFKHFNLSHTRQSFYVLEYILNKATPGYNGYSNNFHLFQEEICNELQFSHDTLLRSFNNTCTNYKSLRLFVEVLNDNLKYGIDPFQGNFLLRYKNNETGYTFFCINIPLLLHFFKISKALKSLSFQRKNRRNPVNTLRNARCGSLILTLDSHKDINNKIRSITSPKEPPPIQQEVRDVSSHEEEMIKIWDKEVSPTVKFLTPARRLRLQSALKEKFGSDLESWRSYCIRIANNGFLMGNGPSKWKADVFWATGPENIEKVLANTYSGQKEVFELPIKSDIQMKDIPSLQGDGISVIALKAIASRIGLSDYNVWMGNIYLDDLEKPIPKLIAPSRFHSDRIEANFRKEIREALTPVLPNFVDIDIVAEERRR